jgi:uncharacterized protein with HEPN domain
MSERRIFDYLQDMLEAERRIGEYSVGMTFEAFRGDHKTQDAVIRNLEIIGEAAKNIPESFRRKYPDLPWKEMAGMRDRLIHHYFGVNLDIVWDVVRGELPGVIKDIEGIIRKNG